MTEPGFASDRGGPLGRALHALASAAALAGGLVLVAMVALVTVSVAGRNLVGQPVPGDVELVELGTAVAVFSFLPYAHLTRAHAVVDVFTAGAPERAKALLDGMAGLLFAALAGMLAWRMALGGAELRAYGEVTMVLGVPLWWGFVPAVACLGLLAAVCLYTGWRGLVRAARR